MDRTRFARSSSKKHPSAADLGTGYQAALGARPDFFGMHVEERGGLSEIERVHDRVESRMHSRLFPEPQSIESAQGRRAARPRGVAEASVVETSARAHIHIRNVASTTVAVA